MRFLRPIVPSLSHIDSSLSSFLDNTGVRGDFGRGEDILLDKPLPRGKSKKLNLDMNHQHL